MKEKKTKSKAFFPVLLVLASLFMSIGYATVNSVILDISGSLAAEAPLDIIITKVDQDDSNDGYSLINFADGTLLNSTITLSNNVEDNEPYVTLLISVYNNTSRTYAFNGTSYLLDKDSYDNDNIIFDLEGIEKRDFLEPGDEKLIKVKFKYKDSSNITNNVLNSLINFDFVPVYNIEYVNITNNNYPTYALEGEKISFNFLKDIPGAVDIEGSADYSYSNPTLTFNNITSDIIINNKCIGNNVIYCRTYYEFTGNNYLDTGVYLFSENNINDNFELTFNIVEYGNNENYATLVNSLYEDHLTYPGFVYRSYVYNEDKRQELHANANSNFYDQKFDISTTKKVTIVRIDGILYFGVNDNSLVQVQDFTNFDVYFDIPVTFGASMDAQKVPFRYFTGALSNMQIKLLGDDITIDDYNKNMETVFEMDNIQFYGNNHVDTGVSLFNKDNINKDFYISFNIAEIGENTNLSTIMNMMYEVAPNYSGLVFRCFPYNDETKQYEIHANTDNQDNGVQVRLEVTQTNKITIIRKKGILYYSINDGDYIRLQDYTNFTSYFETTVNFGSSMDSNNNPNRFFTGRLTNVVIKLEK